MDLLYVIGVFSCPTLIFWYLSSKFQKRILHFLTAGFALIIGILFVTQFVLGPREEVLFPPVSGHVLFVLSMPSYVLCLAFALPFFFLSLEYFIKGWEKKAGGKISCGISNNA